LCTNVTIQIFPLDDSEVAHCKSTCQCKFFARGIRLIKAVTRGVSNENGMGRDRCDRQPVTDTQSLGGLRKSASIVSTGLQHALKLKGETRAKQFT